MKRKVLTTILIGLLSQLCFAQDFAKVKLDNYFDAIGVNNKFMGNVAVSQNGKIMYSKSVDFSDFKPIFLFPWVQAELFPQQAI